MHELVKHLQSCSLIIITINQPLDDSKIPYNNEFQLIHKLIIHNLASILWVIEIKTLII